MIPGNAGGKGRMNQIALLGRYGFISEIAIRHFVRLALQVDVFFCVVPIKIQLGQKVAITAHSNNDPVCYGPGGELEPAERVIVTGDINSRNVIQIGSAGGYRSYRDSTSTNR